MFSDHAEPEKYWRLFASNCSDPLRKPTSKKVLPLAGIRILSLDDHDDTNSLFSTVLELEGALVTVFNTALPALAALEQFQPELLICDLAMPGMDGHQFITEVRTRGWRTPAIAVSGRSEKGSIERALAAGFNLYMGKPVQIKELVNNAIQLLSDEPFLFRGRNDAVSQD